MGLSASLVLLRPWPALRVNHLLTLRFTTTRIARKKRKSGIVAEGIDEQCSWLLNPSCLIDKLLDQVEKLSVVALPVQADNRPHADTQRETLLKPFGL